MWIVAVAWIYVVGLMAVTETSFVAGIMTFLAYCVLPLSILFYLTGGRRRAARRAAASRTDTGASDPDFPASPRSGKQRDDANDSSGDTDSRSGGDSSD